MVIAFIFAYMLQSKLLKGIQRIFKPILFLPQIIPIVASALIWRIIMAKETGVINQILGTSIDFLNAAAIRKWMVVLLQVWRGTGWYMVIFLAGLTTINDEIYDAAKIDGTNAVQMIFRIVLPIMKPIMLFALIMNAIGSIKLYTEPNVLLSVIFVQTDVMTIMNVLLMNLRGGSFGVAAAVGWFVFIIVLVISKTWFKVLGDKDEK
jgi:ABC-type sugar transport system permease subunit